MSIAREEAVEDGYLCEWCWGPAQFRYELWRWVTNAGRRYKGGTKLYVYCCQTHRSNAAAATLEPAPKKQ